ncbi:OB-fold-containig protein [Natronospirillum operosum]|nr:OB-fold-containig protein [Natronospirillum operosum]
MFGQWMDPAFLPFMAAGLAVLVLTAVELSALLFGLALSDALDNMLPRVDIESGEAPGIFSWLGFGKAPFLVVLVVILATFSVSGIVIQHTVLGLLGFTLWPLLAVVLALLITMPSASFLAGVLARVIPSEETSGIHRNELVGCHGHIAQGVATHDRLAEAQIAGPRGLRHWIMVRAERGEQLSPGTPVRIIAREDRTVFMARRVEDPDLLKKKGAAALPG